MFQVTSFMASASVVARLEIYSAAVNKPPPAVSAPA